MNHAKVSTKSKTHTSKYRNGFYLDNDDSATVIWYKWFICYLNKSHVFASYIDKEGTVKLKCVRCGVEKINRIYSDMD